MAHPHGSTDRFHGMPVPPEVTAGAEESLTAQDEPDLVTAHLRPNHSYFGAIDKTLAGFVIVDDEGDDYTLVDVRGGGAVWWQDHETREIHHRLDSFADWASFRRDRAAAEDADEDEVLATYAVGEPPPHGRAVSTPELAARYQWLVWQLAQPLTQNGRPVQRTEEFAGRALAHFVESWPTLERTRAALDAEIGSLAEDPHLSVYWILHTSILGLDAERERVLAAVGDTDLVTSFVDTFGTLGLDGDVPLVPGFRARRSLMFGNVRGRDLGDGPASLTAARICADVYPLGRTVDVAAALDDGSLDTATVAAAVERMPSGLARTAMRALLDSRDPEVTHSTAADGLVAALPTIAEAWSFGLWALDWARPVTGDLAALTAAVRWLLARDSHHRLALAAVRDIQERAGEATVMSEAELTRAEADGEASTRVLKAVIASPDDVDGILAAVDDPALARVVARRALMRGDTDRELAGAMSWAVRIVLATGDEDRTRLAATGLALSGDRREEIVQELGTRITSVDDPLVDMLLRLILDTPDPDDEDFMATTETEDMKEAALLALLPFGHEERVFGPLMEAAESFGPRTTLDPLWGKWFYPLEPETCVLPRLDAGQAHRALKAMIANRLEHPNIHARSAAGHQLNRFDHPAVEEFAIAALDEYGDRYAASAPKGGRAFDYGQTEDDNLEDVVRGLYWVLLNLDTPATRAALTGRLFTERRSYWYAANAVAKVWDEAAHAAILDRLRRTGDHHAAGLYAYALDQHVERARPLVELVEEISGWNVPATEPTDGFFAYALIVGASAALDAGRFDLVRRAWPLAASIPAAPRSPHLTNWISPFEDDTRRARLDEALAGAADTARTALIEKGKAARVKNKPLKLKDADLGMITGTVVGRRLLHDTASGEVWFVDTDGREHAFDGYEAVPPPFTLVEQDGFRPAELSERAMFWTESGDRFAELVRHGDVIAHREGVNDGRFTTFLLRFAEGAAEAFARMKTTMAAGRLTETDPWYVPGKGAVRRTFHHDGDSAYLHVHEGRIEYDGEDFADRDAAIAAHERRELELLASGASLSGVEWSDRMRRDEDMTVAEWLDDRARDDGRDPVWHTEALTAFADSLREYGFLSHVPGLADLTVEVGAGVPEEEIAAFEAARRTPVPEVLRDFWRRVGYASWSIGGRGCRVLRPAEMPARRPAADAVGARYRAQSWSGNAVEYDDMDVLVERLDGEVLTLLSVRETDDGRVFTHVYDHERHVWWEKSLSWMLATGFLSEFTREVKAATHLVEQLFYGQHVNAATVPRYFEWRSPGKDAKFWELYWDETNGVLATRYGRLGAAGKVGTKRMDPVKGAKKAASLVAAKTAAGYREV